MNQADSEKIDSYINGNPDDSEKEYVESLFLNGENNFYLRNCVLRDWEVMLNNASSPDVNLNHLLDKIHHLIRINYTLKKKQPLEKIIQVYMKVAAILLLPLILAGVLVYSFLDTNIVSKNENIVNSTIYAPMGARVSFNLPDGTSGMLNSGSHLSYVLPFNKNRKISLEGEAWFEVKSDVDHPFEISLGNSTVKVIGTKLNISAYPVESYVEVVL